MTAFRIPFRPDPFFFERISLEGEPYVLTFRYNDVGAFWVMDINQDNQSQTPVFTGLKLALGANALATHPTETPPGAFIPLRFSGIGENIGRDEFSSGDVRLFYFTSDDPIIS